VISEAQRLKNTALKRAAAQKDMTSSIKELEDYATATKNLMDKVKTLGGTPSTTTTK
jgi:hypothetical protein